MPRRPIRQKDLESPDRILGNLINDYIEGRLGGAERVIYKASVVEIDHVGGQLSGPSSKGGRRKEEPPNPRNSVVARVITDNLDSYTDDDSLPVFWPLFPYDLMPVKQGEHIYVLYEDEDLKHGMWIGRIPDPNKIHDLNFTPGTKRYSSNPDNELQEGTSETERIVQDVPDNIAVAPVSPEFEKEQDIPEFEARVGDRVIQGSNNATIILSRDRVDTVESGAKQQAGTIDLVAGRAGENIDLTNDSSRILISMKTDGDSNFNLSSFGAGAGEASFVISKADHVRVVGRQGVKIVVESGPTSIVISESGKITIDASDDLEINCPNVQMNTDGDIVLNAGGETKVGSSGASSKLVKGDKLKDFLQQTLVDILASAPVDVCGVPGVGIINSAVGSAISAKLATYDFMVLSDKNKVE